MSTISFEIAPSKVPQILSALKLFKGVSKIQIVANEESDDAECPICKAHNYTLAPEVEAELLKDLATIEEQRKNGTLKSYKNIDELREALLA